jgi:hypothetical protein
MIKELFEDYVKSQNRRREKKHFYVTDNGRCRRQLYYSLTDIKTSEVNSYESKRRMSIGSNIEDSILSMWVDSGLLMTSQQKVEVAFRDNFEIHGYCDAIVEINGIRHCAELKSFYGYYQAKEYRLGKPKPEYVKQLALYIYYMQGQICRLSNIGSLFLEDRADCTQYEFLVRVDPSGLIEYSSEGYGWSECGKISDILEHFDDVVNHIKDGSVPEPDFNYKYPIDKLEAVSKAQLAKARAGKAVLGDWQCKYCDYKTTCLESRNVELGYTEKELEEIRKIK